MGGREAHQVAVQRRVALRDGGGDEAALRRVEDLLAFVQRRFRVEDEAPVRAAEADHRLRGGIGGIGHAGEGEEEVAGLVAQ